VAEDFSVTRSLRNELGSPSSYATPVVLAVAVIAVRQSDALRCLSPVAFSGNTPISSFLRAPVTIPPRGERRTTTELFVQLFFPRFETFQRHFNERTRSVLVAAQPSATLNRTENRAAPLPLSLSERRSPFPLNVRDPSTPGPSLNADRESALFQSRANGNNSPRAKKIIKC